MLIDKLKKDLPTKNTDELVKLIYKNLEGGEVLGLVGQLGAGKTYFTQKLSELLKVKTQVTSPTFTLIEEHRGKLFGKDLDVFHLDLYRIESIQELEQLGIDEFIAKPNTLTLVEWADLYPSFLPKATIYLDISKRKLC